MRRICRGSSFRLAARVARPAASAVLGVALLLGTPGLAGAEPSGSSDSLSALIAEVAKANQHLEDLRGAIEAEQESVNKALVDVQTARDNAAAAQHDVEVSQRAVKDANAAIAAAQRRFDAFAAATYVNGPSNSYLTAAGPDDIIATASAGRTLAASSRQVMANLQRARTEQVNKESAARLAKQKADRATAEAQARQDAAVSALTAAHRKFGEQQAEVNRLAAERDAAQARLEAARTWSAPGGGTQAGSRSRDRWDPGGPASARPSDSKQWDGEWDPTLPMVPSANVPGDPIAIINTVLGISATSSQVTANMGRSFLQKLGILKPNDTGITNGRIPRVYGRQASEYVIRRGLSQLGVPYSWGGGTAAGPSRGIGSGADTVGFDCSGLILYSFAGVGIKLPHYSGSQYNLGRKIPSAQMRRGDVIFYGPGGSQHVTLYLGDGQMLEAPDVGLRVRVAPVRTSGMTPYVVRYIEY
ncbi:peptidase M23 [Mycobacterium heckeshornense]|uniref:Peptidase M23 n=1 Tax=Mycobacterium heckeshornense TaxID=110505 RepID=A0A2G8BB58_9MYCO|nr:NlpC/P60 family peptidoglycan endopeptidase RipA [Mycobacterium heckeshornense]KMV21313.1 peptidase M23 [Mycobacterium heckeshornense]MCV7037040.1 NlpC/P60 family peptidoglycan endopeptidase RipA [Mycobacterium heckeshornense]PIJ34993.1 peptidase M23 [Mycobacterium heckeshornense]BCO36197.1 peptidase M23 [Mycobacterium heckeshornense]